MRYKYRMKKLIENNSASDREIIRQARKDARRSRVKYFNDMAGRVTNIKRRKKSTGNTDEPVPVI